MSADLRPCRCGADLCIQQRTLREGYRCVREAGLAALQAGSTTVQAGLRERLLKHFDFAIAFAKAHEMNIVRELTITVEEAEWLRAAALQERAP